MYQDLTSLLALMTLHEVIQVSVGLHHYYYNTVEPLIYTFMGTDEKWCKL